MEFREELPKPVAEMDGGAGILSEDRIAYPGMITRMITILNIKFLQYS